MKHKHQLTGIVISDKMEKTIVVEVERIKSYPKYKAHFRVSKKYKVHDEKKGYKARDYKARDYKARDYKARDYKARDYKVGDRVVIEECRPISKDKRWRVITKIN